MLTLNLLPPQEKEKLIFVMRTRAVLAFMSAVVAVFFIGLMLFLPTVFQLAIQKSDVMRVLAEERENQARTGVKEKIERIQTSNRLAEVVTQHEKDSPGLFDLFEAIIRATPAAIQLEGVSWKPQAREVAIEGFSPERRVLIEFLRALEQQPRVARVSSPIANIIRGTNIRFSLVVSVK